MAEAAPPLTTVFIQDFYQREQEPPVPSQWKNIKGTLTSSINQLKEKYTRRNRTSLYERKISLFPLVYLPKLVLERVLIYLDASDIFHLCLTCRFLKGIINGYAKQLPCLHQTVRQFYGETFYEQQYYQKKHFCDYFNGITWMPALSQQNTIRPQIRAIASHCPLMTASLARMLSNKGYINKKRLCILPTVSDTTAIKMLPDSDNRLISAHYDGNLKVWNLMDNIPHCLKTLRHNNHGDVIHFITYTTAYSFITYSFQVISFWNLKQPEGEELLSSFTDHSILQDPETENSDISAIQLISDQDARFASGYGNGHMVVWGLAPSNTAHFDRLYNISFGQKTICNISSLGDNYFATMTCTNHKLVHIWKVCHNEGFQRVSNLRFLHDIKTINKLGPNKLIVTMGTKERFGVFKRDFLTQAPLQASWFNTLQGNFEYEMFFSNTTLVELLDGRFASIGEEHVHIWDPSSLDENTSPVRSLPFPPSTHIANPEQNRRFALFPLNGPRLAVAVTNSIEIWNLTPADLDEHDGHQA